MLVCVQTTPQITLTSGFSPTPKQGDGVVYSEDDNVVSMVLTGKSASAGTLAAGIAAAATAYLE